LSFQAKSPRGPLFSDFWVLRWDSAERALTKIIDTDASLVDNILHIGRK
jgi:hypothetical protein